MNKEIDPLYAMGFRAGAFGFISWVVIRETLGLWRQLAGTAATHGWPPLPSAFEFVFFSAPAPNYFIEAISAGGAAIVVLAMLTRSKVPGWMCLALTLLIGVAVSSILRLLQWQAAMDTIFNGRGLGGDSMLSPRVLSILILGVEAAVICWLLWTWRKKWREARFPSFIGSPESEPPPDSD